MKMLRTSELFRLILLNYYLTLYLAIIIYNETPKCIKLSTLLNKIASTTYLVNFDNDMYYSKHTWEEIHQNA